MGVIDRLADDDAILSADPDDRHLVGPALDHPRRPAVLPFGEPGDHGARRALRHRPPVGLSRCAGIAEWLRAASVAAAHGLQISAHCAPSLHLHPACAVPNVRHLEYFADHVRVDHLLFEGVVEPKGGVLEPDLSRPGIGLELRRADAAAYRRDA